MDCRNETCTLPAVTSVDMNTCVGHVMLPLCMDHALDMIRVSIENDVVTTVMPH
jgi:hypothetical protein